MITRELEEYLNSLEKRDASNVLEEDIIQFQEMILESPEVYCLAMDFIDRWTRKSNEFTVASAYHIHSSSEKFKGLPLSRKYGSYYKRVCDEKDVMSQRLMELVGERNK